MNEYVPTKQGGPGGKLYLGHPIPMDPQTQIRPAKLAYIHNPSCQVDEHDYGGRDGSSGGVFGLMDRLGWLLVSPASWTRIAIFLVWFGWVWLAEFLFGLSDGQAPESDFCNKEAYTYETICISMQ